ncbi:uncharacterized protein GVI51_D03201 [Nakaseomyces glabratus]|uniref:Partial AB-hydrolase lipase domain-containing protein n=2 Tax=Candida glabrata TaxID=5478 RepID=Q6FW36_CANGA|nr:uncharacterized protein CAGL0D03256g [Nakaseomyces glabratus]KAH7608005.1 hypothetical protein J7293_00811 [Nakaseomyces glabratus]KAH7608411.1 hypothetical protein J7294_00810 [Nakaseomyces glabratus]KTB01337.1 Sterol esterase 2 [Nakaseomyces glabratus]KTB03619.1 Sterol esterase 2 [Nakaseomyces glabratus]KTB18079.1 Sterol esterase 2 [Nakaseomyces glabratus]|eukprot:XP_445558.1 uncharacterized protein CAGL0D03256g [[Candida] glabrata]
MTNYLVHILHEIVSDLMIGGFMAALFILALFHNLFSSHIFGNKDPRDVRKSSTKIYPERHKHNKSHGREKSHNRGMSTSSTTPLDIEVDEDNNIEYDNTITGSPEPSTLNEDSYEENRQFYLNNITENPFDSISEVEDSQLVPNLEYYYSQYNIEIETFRIETKDGYIIDLLHMKHNEPGMENIQRYPLLLLHGLLQSCGAYASTGRASLAYFFHQAGFDVWLGNNRCGLNPDWNKNKIDKPHWFNKWDWDIKDFVKYDIRALVEQVKSRTGFSKITLIGHSQGTTQSLLGLINGPELYDEPDKFTLIDSLDNFIALAPAIYPGPLLDEKMFVRFMAASIDSPWVFGQKSFIPFMMRMRKLMAGTKMFSFFSYIMFNYMFDWNDKLWDKKLRDRCFLFSPVYVSVKLMRWWLTPDRSITGFKNGAHKLFPDTKTWFPVLSDTSSSSSSLNLKNVPNHLNAPRETANDFPHIMLFAPKQDRLVDGERLINHFINYESRDIYKIWYIDEYSHLDVLWAKDVIERIGKPIVENMRIPSNETVHN